MAAVQHRLTIMVAIDLQQVDVALVLFILFVRGVVQVLRQKGDLAN